ncbi:MAG: response regulator transcription factor [Anaerolineae bacterium]|nr:response regulator transcription factor [Anaerolineae bacterium]
MDGGERFIQFLWTAKERGIGVPYTTQLLDSTVQKAVVSRQATRDAHSDIEPLSDRELEVLRLIADGASNREIAEALVVSVGTVKKHLNNIFLKLDAHNRTQAVATARNYNLL